MHERHQEDLCCCCVFVSIFLSTYGSTSSLGTNNCLRMSTTLQKKTGKIFTSGTQSISRLPFEHRSWVQGAERPQSHTRKNNEKKHFFCDMLIVQSSIYRRARTLATRSSWLAAQQLGVGPPVATPVGTSHRALLPPLCLVRVDFGTAHGEQQQQQQRANSWFGASLFRSTIQQTRKIEIVTNRLEKRQGTRGTRNGK